MDPSTQQKMTLIACRVLTICIWLCTLTRPLVVDLNVVFTQIGIVEGIIALILYGAVKTELLGRAAPIIVSLMLPAICLPYLLISGGVNSPIAYVLIVFPFYAALMLGTRFCWIATLAICVAIIPLGLFSESIVDVLEAPQNEKSTLARIYWIIAALLSAAYFSTHYLRINMSLSKALRDEANLDFLTKVANRRGLERILDREADNAERYNSWLSLILLDIDDFKHFNDTFGHRAGDRCLTNIAQALQNVLRDKQDYVGRWGGEEFVIVLPDTNPDDTKMLAEIIRSEIEFLRINEKDSDIHVTATLGCCSAAGKATDIETMLEAADRALYDGKERGKNRVMFAPIREQLDLQL